MLETLIRFDTGIFLLINGLHHPVADHIFMIVTQLGSAWVTAPLLCGIFALSVPRKRLIRFVILGFAGLVMTGAVNTGVKFSVRRLRPAAYFKRLERVRQESERDQVHIVGPKLRFRSFPSGHTATAFAAATLIAICLGGWFRVSYVVALLVGYSRIYLGAHFPLDVVFGGILGSLIMGSLLLTYAAVPVSRIREKGKT